MIRLWGILLSLMIVVQTTAGVDAAKKKAPAATTAAATTAATTAAKPAATTAAEATTAAATTAAKKAAAKAAPKIFRKQDLTFNIVLDPGHGGNDTGAEGPGWPEKKITLKIGKFLKEELEKYENVNVSLTRNKDKWVDLHKRMKIAKKRKADLVVSLHIDSASEEALYYDGCSALVAKKGSFQPEMASDEAKLARSILGDLEKLGITNRGLARHTSPNVKEYPDGSRGDYSAIIRDGMLFGISSVLVEHGFVEEGGDYYEFLASDAKLRKIARADAAGIARFLRLRSKITGRIPAPMVKDGKKRVCTADKNSYISLRRKVYNNTVYRKYVKGGAERFRSSNIQERRKQEEATLTAENNTVAESTTAAGSGAAPEGTTALTAETEQGTRQETLSPAEADAINARGAKYGFYISMLFGFALVLWAIRDHVFAIAAGWHDAYETDLDLLGEKIAESCRIFVAEWKVLTARNVYPEAEEKEEEQTRTTPRKKPAPVFRRRSASLQEQIDALAEAQKELARKQRRMAGKQRAQARRDARRTGRGRNRNRRAAS